MAAIAGLWQALARLAPRLPDGDRELLRRFAESRDGPAFRELLRRHGGLVWSVCRRHSRERADAEDAFQATFLVLAARPHAVRRGDSLGAWLYGTARRTATRLRSQRRLAAPGVEVAAPPEDSGRWDAVAVLDEELLRLPAKYRDPLTAYYLLARTHDEVADELGQSVSTVRRRLEAGRELLRERLDRRGVELGVVVAALTAQAANAPASLCDATLTAATLGAATVPPLVQGVLTMLWYAKLKTWAVGVAVAVATVGGVVTVATIGRGHSPPAVGATKPDVPAEKGNVLPVAPAMVVGLPDGNYLLSVVDGPTQRNRLSILKIETKGGRPVVSVLDSGPPPAKHTATDLAIDGIWINFKLDLGTTKVTHEGPLDLKTGNTTWTKSARRFYKFDGVLDPQSPTVVRGSLVTGEQASAVFLESTDKVKLGADDTSVEIEMPAELAAARKRADAIYVARAKAVLAKDLKEKTRYEQESEAARLATEAEMPGVYKNILDKLPGTTAELNAAKSLIGDAVKSKSPVYDVGHWAATVEANSSQYGSHYADSSVQWLAESLSGVDDYLPLAVKYCERAAALKGLSLKARVAALSRLARVQTAALAVTERELARCNAELDAAALRPVPLFKATPFPGRNDKAANRVAVLELFTGVHCGPCVAADVAFDAAIQAYPARDVVLLQYHLNIPAPDPLANADTATRADYYGRRFGGNFEGTPRLAVNGKPEDAAGGGLADSERSFGTYKNLLDEALTQSTPVTVSGTATTTGDTLAIAVEVGRVAKDSVKLRLVLVEETVKYAGGNGLRFHHNVVRSFLGTVGGLPVSGLKGGKYATTVSVKELRDKLTAELAKANADKPLPDAERPLELKNLKVMALIQDDTTGVILQAATLDAAGK